MLPTYTSSESLIQKWKRWRESISKSSDIMIAYSSPQWRNESGEFLYFLASIYRGGLHAANRFLSPMRDANRTFNIRLLSLSSCLSPSLFVCARGVPLSFTATRSSIKLNLSPADRRRWRIVREIEVHAGNCSANETAMQRLFITLASKECTLFIRYFMYERRMRTSKVRLTSVIA